jgi:two-component system response regulator VicR
LAGELGVSKTILIVDDEKELVALLEGALSAKGYRVLTAYDGEQALQRVQSAVPDLILLDIRMPKMSGLGFYNAICLPVTGKPLCPVLILTAHELMEDVFKDLSVQGFMIKPVKIEQLLIKIGEIFDTEKKQHEVDAASAENSLKRSLISRTSTSPKCMVMATSSPVSPEG